MNFPCCLPFDKSLLFDNGILFLHDYTVLSLFSYVSVCFFKKKVFYGLSMFVLLHSFYQTFFLLFSLALSMMPSSSELSMKFSLAISILSLFDYSVLNFLKIVHDVLFKLVQDDVFGLSKMFSFDLSMRSSFKLPTLSFDFCISVFFQLYFNVGPRDNYLHVYKPNQVWQVPSLLKSQEQKILML